MGFEYHIKVQLTPTEKDDLLALLKRKSSFRSTTHIKEVEYLQFWIKSTDPEWPDIKLAFDEEGINVIQSLSSELWSNLKDLHKFLLSLNKTIDIEEL